jgi:hypothetical protein
MAIYFAVDLVTFVNFYSAFKTHRIYEATIAKISPAWIQPFELPPDLTFLFYPMPDKVQSEADSTL